MSFWQSCLARFRVAENPLKTQRRVELVLALLLLLLLFQLLYGALRLSTLSEPDAIAPAADALAVIKGRTPGLVDEAGSREIRERPLFWASRRPSSEEVVDEEALAAQAQAAERGELKDLELVGVFGDGRAGGAIVLIKGEKQRILQGGEVLGWKLESVAANGVVMVSGLQRQQLDLKPVPPAAANQQTQQASKRNAKTNRDK